MYLAATACLVRPPLDGDDFRSCYLNSSFRCHLTLAVTFGSVHFSSPRVYQGIESLTSKETLKTFGHLIKQRKSSSNVEQHLRV